MLRSIILILLLLLSIGCNRAVPGLYPPQQGEKQYELYIVNNHWHTGMTIQARDLTPKMLELTQRTPESGWIEIGWGDDGFYRAKQITSGLSLQAMCCSKGSVLHIWTLSSEPRRFYGNFDVDLYQIHISEEGRTRLMNRLEETFARDSIGSSVRLQDGLFEHSDFFLARGRYGMFQTCNHWLASTLRTTGFPITPFWALTANNVGWQIKHYGREYEPELVQFEQ